MSQIIMPGLQSQSKDKPQPNIEKINHVMKQFEEVFERVKPNSPEMALMALTILQSMLEYCESTKQPCPATMGIMTPGGYEISYTIRKAKRSEQAQMKALLPGLGG